MTITINSGIYNYYYEAVNCLLEDPYIGRTVTLYYETKQPCTCSGYCEECFGSGYIVKTDNVKFRIYNSPKDWIKTSSNVDFITGRVQVMGYIEDSVKLERSSYVKHGSLKYILAGKTFRHGFGERYFIGFLDLV